MPYGICTECEREAFYGARRGEYLSEQRSRCCNAEIRAKGTGEKAVQCAICKLDGIRTQLRELYRPPCLFVILESDCLGYRDRRKIVSGPHEPVWLCYHHANCAWPADHPVLSGSELEDAPLVLNLIAKWVTDIRASHRKFTEEDLDANPELVPIQACSVCRGRKKIRGPKFDWVDCHKCSGGV